MKKILIPALLMVVLLSAYTIKQEKKETITLTKERLRDKIKGGWAGQTIGVSFGSYTEFRHNGTFIQDYQVIPWEEGYVKKLMLEWPDLYDDIYMDLTFVEVLERVGFDAPVDSFANAFANASYNLWHANQAARYNILNGIKAPQSGHWLNNPHADDIDYQIEADFSGLMHPGMPNSASALSDKVGHIMNYGDGWYGGVYVGAMYSLAFLSDDVNYVVNEALKTIPKESDFYKCIADVIKWHKKNPNDWKQTWYEVQKKWSEEVGCPDGVFSPFDIDAKVNSAYVVMGLLYGKGDYTRTLEIATRSGQDSDCNPSTVGGILGAILGYSKIPDYWKKGLNGSEDMNFKYTNMSLNKVYETSYQYALKAVAAGGGKVNDTEVIIKVQKPEAVKLEKGFEGAYPVVRVPLNRNIDDVYEFDFDGTGFVLRGNTGKNDQNLEDYDLKAKVYVDGKIVETANLPTGYRARRHEICWRYQLPNGKHRVKIEVSNPKKGYYLRAWDYIAYSDKAVDGITAHK